MFELVNEIGPCQLHNMHYFKVKFVLPKTVSPNKETDFKFGSCRKCQNYIKGFIANSPNYRPSTHF